MTILKRDGLCALFRHHWAPHPDKKNVQICLFCNKTRRVRQCPTAK
jgi:hypothetical protein